jgi:exosortase
MDMDQPDSNHGLVRSRFERVRRARPLLMGDASLLRRAALVIAGLGLVALYGDVAVGLVNAWIINPDYSHGFLIVPLCAYFVWERWRRLAALELRPSSAGLVVVAGSLCLFVAGQLGAEQFLARISLIGVLAGSVAFVLGLAHVRMLAWTFCFALLMIPLPAIVFNEVALPLQLLASTVAEETLLLFSIPVLREGNVIFLSNATLEVAEACSGIRSLVSLLTVGIVYGYFTEDRIDRRAILALSTLPIAVVANALRVAGTGVLAHFAGQAAADGFFHVFAGWLVFMSAVAMMFVLQGVMRWVSSHSPGAPIVSEAVR